MTTPTWLDSNDYPFTSHYVAVPDGRIHYVDEGEGDPIIMLHGTPTWSYLYRHLIKGLRDTYRVIVPDHLGFGLSDKPTNYSYRPADQARNIAAFIDQLDLDNITLVVHDFGGSIGLSYALQNPQKVKRIIILNTWMWSLKNDFQKVLAGRFLGSPLGKFLCLRFNFEVNVIMPSAYADRSKLTPAIHKHYRQPLQDPIARYAVWVYGRELFYSHEWFDQLWQQREAIQDIPALICWGMKDPVFGASYLERWQTVFNNAETVTFPDAGHYVQEEAGENLVPPIADFLQRVP